MTVVALKARSAPQPKPIAYAQVDATTRAAADALERRAKEIGRIFSGSFTGGPAMNRLPELLKAARAAIDEIEEAGNA